MNPSPQTSDSSTSRPVPCSQSEAIELAMHTMLAAHAVVAVAVLVLEIIFFGPMGVWIGLAVVVGLVALLPVAVLPPAFVIGWLAYRLFSQSTVSVAMAARLMAILFELNLLGWIVVLSLSF